MNPQRERTFVVGIDYLTKLDLRVRVKLVSTENVELIQMSFEHSPMKLTHRANRELGIPQTSVWHVQAIPPASANDNVKRIEICDRI